MIYYILTVKIRMIHVTLTFDLSTRHLLLVIICAKYGKNPSRKVHAGEGTWRDVPYFCSYIAKSWLNDLEDICQEQRSKLTVPQTHCFAVSVS